jgi:hypothetical protein
VIDGRGSATELALGSTHRFCRAAMPAR